MWRPDVAPFLKLSGLLADSSLKIIKINVAFCNEICYNATNAYWSNCMSIAVRISDSIVKKARARSKALNRSVAGQIEYWAKMGEILEDNPELSFSFVQKIT